jgi:hypothetical protein
MVGSRNRAVGDNDISPAFAGLLRFRVKQLADILPYPADNWPNTWSNNWTELA